MVRRPSGSLTVRHHCANWRSNRALGIQRQAEVQQNPGAALPKLDAVTADLLCTQMDADVHLTHARPICERPTTGHHLENVTFPAPVFGFRYEVIRKNVKAEVHMEPAADP